VDILINSAGIFPFGATHLAAEADFDQVFGINVKVPRQTGYFRSRGMLVERSSWSDDATVRAAQ
jgi:NAD(P)-dependent dehydrogenase (short-subunit alcohol dehydrogenase family)